MKPNKVWISLKMLAPKPYRMLMLMFKLSPFAFGRSKYSGLES